MRWSSVVFPDPDGPTSEQLAFVHGEAHAAQRLNRWLARVGLCYRLDLDDRMLGVEPIAVISDSWQGNGDWSHLNRVVGTHRFGTTIF
jgi:hypothetical protein